MGWKNSWNSNRFSSRDPEPSPSPLHQALSRQSNSTSKIPVLNANGQGSQALVGQWRVATFPLRQSRYRWALIDPLTPREIEMLRLVCDGLSNQEICQTCALTLDGVKYHLKNVFGKLGVKRRTQAVAMAVYLGLVEPRWLAEGRLRAVCEVEAEGRSNLSDVFDEI